MPRLATALLLALTGAVAGAAAASPSRIVSLNLCTDQLLVDLVSHDRIAGLSPLATDALVSPVAAIARRLPTTRADAESVLAFDPDLVLAGTITTPATLAILRRVGRRVEQVAMASDLAGVRAAIRQVAAAVDAGPRGEALIAALDAELSAAAPAAGKRPSALIYEVNGLAAGAGSLADALLDAAGFANKATLLGLGAGGALPLEVLVADPPDLIVLSGPSDEYRTVVAENLRHPALAAVMAERAATVLPWRLWLCGTHHVGDAVRGLAKARRAFDTAVSRP